MCPAGTLHRFWVDVESEDHKRQDVVLLLNATDSGKDFMLDRVFFENWYGMRYDSLTYGKGIDLVQMLCVSQRSSIRASFPYYYRAFFFFFSFWILNRVLDGHARSPSLIVVPDFRCRRSLHSLPTIPPLFCPRLHLFLCPYFHRLLGHCARREVHWQPIRLPPLFPRIHDRLGVRPG